MKHYFLLLLFVSLSSFSFAQTGAVSGRVVDAQSGEPLPFTTVAAYQNEQLVTGTTTGDNGRFNLELPYGSYRLVVQFLSYAQKQFNNVTLNAQEPRYQLGDVALSPDEETLQAVEVEGQRMEMELSLDKKVFNVADNLAVKGGSATDVLENIPSVAVDVEGNVSLRGSDNVRVLIDGKPSGLTGASALRQLPAELIERVEVVTNPSARYEAQGMAGIINIILKKNRQKGLNGSFDLTTGWPHNHGLAANLNIRRKSANFFVNLGTRYRVNLGGGYNYDTFEELRPDTLVLDPQTDERYIYNFITRNSDREHERGGWSHNIRLGSDFFLTERDVLTAAFLYNRGNSDNEANINYSFLLPSGSPSLYSFRTDMEEELDQNLEWSLDYRRTYEEKDKVLSANVQYRRNTDEEFSRYQENFFQPSGNMLITNRQRSLNQEENRELLLQFDFIDPLPAEKGQWEAGARSSFRRIGNDYGVALFQGGEFISLPYFTNDFLYEEQVHAGYLQGGLKAGRMSYQAGLRLEYTSISTQIDERINERDFLNLFPSAFASYKLSEQSSVQASYSRRIRRPHFRQLNPFWTFSDIRSWRVGNPDLNPEFTNSYEVGYLHNWNKTSLTSSVFYRTTTDGIEFLSSFSDVEELIADPADRAFFTGGPIRIASPYNISERQDLGVEFVLSSDLTRWWTLNGSANVFSSATEAYTFSSELGNNRTIPGVEAVGMNGRLSSRMRFQGGLNLQQTLFYMAPQNMLQGRRLSMTFLSIGASKEILKNKGTISLTIDDVLNTRKWRSETIVDGTINVSEFQWRRRAATLTFNYRLNQDKRSGKRDNRRQQGGGDDDMDF